MFRITWRGIRQYPVRFALSVLSVVLGIAFITGTFALRTSLSSTFDDITDSSYSATVYIQLAVDDNSQAAAMVEGSQTGGIDMTLGDDLTSLSDVASVEPTLEGNVVLIGADGTAAQTGGAPTLAFPVSDADDNFTVVSGRMPRNAHEIAIESSALESTGLQVGDVTRLVIGGDVREVTIVGDLSYDSAAFGAILMAIDEQSAIDAFAPTGQVPSIGVYGRDGVDANGLAKQVASALGGDVTALPSDKDGYRATLTNGTSIDVRTADSMRADTRDVINEVIGFVGVFLLVFAAVALFVGGFIIANTFAMSVRQRMREIAVLRAIGASPTQVFGSVVGQAVIVGIVGAFVGIAAGMGLIGIVRAVLSSMGSQMSSEIPLTPETVIVALVAGVVVSAVAAAVPARRAATIPPVAAMRDDVTSEKSLRPRGIIGAALVVAGFGCAIAGGAIGTDGGELLGIGAVAVLVGALLAAPLIVPPVLRILAWPFVRVIKPMGALALGNVVRNPRRTASTASALMIGMALVGGAAVLATSTQASMSSMITKSANSDYILQSAQQDFSGIPAAAATAVRDLAQAGRVDTLYFSMLPVDGEQQFVVAGDPGLFPASATLSMSTGSMAALDQGKALVQKSYADDHEVTVGDTIEVGGLATGATLGADDSPATAAHVEVGGIYDDGSIIGAPVILPLAAFETAVPAPARVIDTMFATAATGVTPDQLHAALTDAVKPFYVVSVMDRDQWVTQMSNQIDQILYLLYALLGLSIVIAILGIVNTLALSVIERTREIGLMRAVGLGRLQLSTTMTLESILISVFGAALGLAIGVSLASFLPRVLALRGFTDLAIPWSQLGWMLLLSALVGVVAAAWPGLRAARMPVLQSIASE